VRLHQEEDRHARGVLHLHLGANLDLLDIVAELIVDDDLIAALRTLLEGGLALDLPLDLKDPDRLVVEVEAGLADVEEGVVLDSKGGKRVRNRGQFLGAALEVQRVQLAIDAVMHELARLDQVLLLGGLIGDADRQVQGVADAVGTHVLDALLCALDGGGLQEPRVFLPDDEGSEQP